MSWGRRTCPFRQKQVALFYVVAERDDAFARFDFPDNFDGVFSEPVSSTFTVAAAPLGIGAPHAT